MRPPGECYDCGWRIRWGQWRLRRRQGTTPEQWNRTGSCPCMGRVHWKIILRRPVGGAN